MKPVRIEDLEVFVYVAKSQSFSAAARLLNISPVVASNAIKRLEDSLGAQFLVRNTRRVRITREGSRYLAHAEQVLRAVKDGEAEINAEKLSGASRLSLSLPSDFGRSYLLAWIEEYFSDYDDIELEISIGDLLVDMHAVPIDLTIRYGTPKDSELIYLPIAEQNRRILCASPSYLERHATILSVDDLSQHNCLRFKVGGVVYSRWNFNSDVKPSSILVNGSRSTDDSELVRQWAVSGLGIAYKSELDVVADFRAGKLVRVLPDVQGELAPLVLLAAHRSVITPTISSLVAFLRKRCLGHLLIGAG